jgi:hypothetical protein
MADLKVLFLSRNYPSCVLPQAGLWVEGLVRQVSRLCEARVVAPVPYCPPLPGAGEFTRFRRIPARRRDGAVEVRCPRFVTGPGYSLHGVEASTYYWGVRREVDRLRREFPFDLIHAHFTYPDGAAAARLARRHRVPVLITEHAPWVPWMEQYPRVRRQAIRAARECRFHLPVSRYVRDTILRFTGEPHKLRVTPVGVDGSVFIPAPPGRAPHPDQILYVGIMRHVKGIDVLLRALRRLVERRPAARLVLVGGGFYRRYRIEAERLRALAGELGLSGHAEFVGLQPPEEVARLMRESALLVLPSRAESFGAVLVEALASGTPVVATRCGGPEDIVAEGVGLLVPPEDEAALAAAMENVLQNRRAYDPARLRAHALDNFSWERIARATMDLYREALPGSGGAAAAARREAG